MLKRAGRNGNKASAEATTRLTHTQTHTNKIHSKSAKQNPSKIDEKTVAENLECDSSSDVAQVIHHKGISLDNDIQLKRESRQLKNSPCAQKRSLPVP